MRTWDQPTMNRALDTFKHTNMGLRETAKLYGIPPATFSRHVQKLEGRETPAPKQRGRPTALTSAEELIIAETVVEFANRGTPLGKECFLDLVQFFIEHLDPQRVERMPFVDGRPGDTYIYSFLKRHPEITLKRRNSLEQQRAEAMTSFTLAVHFARLVKIFKKYSITDAAQIFNLDESGFSSRTIGRGRAKSLASAFARCNSTDLNWARNAQHVTLMPVVSADGKPWNPVAILEGKKHKWRTTVNGNTVTPTSFLPPGTVTAYRKKASMSKSVFRKWAKKFVKETKVHRETHKNLVVLLDGYGSHISYDTLSLLEQNHIICVAIPSHTIHRLQVLDYTVFASTKTSMSKLINQRSLLCVARNIKRNDVYTICELMTKAYEQSVTGSNIKSGFRACGVWNEEKKGPDISVIRERDITNTDGNTSKDAIADVKELYQKFVDSRESLESDISFNKNGSLNTKNGALLSARETLRKLKDNENAAQAAREEKKRKAREAEEERERKRIESEQLKEQKRRDAELAKAEKLRKAEEKSRLQKENAERKVVERMRKNLIAARKLVQERAQKRKENEEKKQVARMRQDLQAARRAVKKEMLQQASQSVKVNEGNQRKRKTVAEGRNTRAKRARK